MLLITAIAIWVAVIIVTIIVLVPINNKMMQLPSDSFPAESQRQHQKWDMLHRLRVVALVAAMICWLVAIGV